MTTLQEVLSFHQWRYDLRGCTCDDASRIGNDAAMAQHQAEAVASAGLQVIQLPDASRTATTSSDTELWEYPMSVCLWETKEPRCISFHEQPSLVTPKDARELAAALLAAAAAVEAAS